MQTAMLLLHCCALSALIVVEQTLHARHRPPPGMRHVEVPARVDVAAAALREAPFPIEWRKALDGLSPADVDAALALVHDAEHLRMIQRMSQTGGGFDTDTYCAPGSWEAMVDAAGAWMECVWHAADGRGPALALTRPAGHHATRNVAMGFGLVNFAACAVAAYLERAPTRTVAILDWDIHHGNGVAAAFAHEPRVRYASTHEAGGFPGTGADEGVTGPCANLLSVSLPRGSGREEFLSALELTTLPFLLRGGGGSGQPGDRTSSVGSMSGGSSSGGSSSDGSTSNSDGGSSSSDGDGDGSSSDGDGDGGPPDPWPDLLLICAGYDGTPAIPAPPHRHW